MCIKHSETDIMMNCQRFSILLIFMIVYMPVATAFNHCTGLSDHKSSSQALIDVVPAFAGTGYEHQDTNQGQHQDSTQSYCYMSGSCSFHVCGGEAVISSIPHLITNTALLYSTPDPRGLHSTVITPEIKPPIILWEGVCQTSRSICFIKKICRCFMREVVSFAKLSP